jgi:hypothetical protein
MTMYYCSQCQKVRGFPESTLTEKAVQCDFCDRQICKCYQGSYANLVGLDRNPDKFKTAGDSIQVSQILSLPKDLPVTKIHPKDKKHYLNDKMVLVFQNKIGEDGSYSVNVVNRHTGEQICIQM